MATSTVSAEITLIQAKLHDGGSLWSSTELLRLWNDGYREFLAQSKAVRRFWNIGIPGGVAFAFAYEWETAHATKGTHNRFTVAIYDGRLAATFLWESEFIEGIAPTNSNDNMTQPWERVYSGQWDGWFRFALPKDHEAIRRVAWDDRRLDPVTVKELDEYDRQWHQDSGEPVVYTAGLGRVKTVEVYAIQTTYEHGYALRDAEHGIPRKLSGSRTYTFSNLIRQYNSYAYTSTGDTECLTQDFEPPIIDGIGWRFTRAAADTSDGFAVHLWEKEIQDGETTFTDSSDIGTYTWELEVGADNSQDFAVGTCRGVDSPDRQYLPAYYDQQTSQRFLGRIVTWESSVNNISVLQVILPNRDLITTDIPTLLPEQMLKYVRYYVWSRAFGRQGEGQKPLLAAHFERRFKGGVMLFNKLSALTHRDVVYARRPAEMGRRRRPPRPKLPPEFPRLTV